MKCTSKHFFYFICVVHVFGSDGCVMYTCNLPTFLIKWCGVTSKHLLLCFPANLHTLRDNTKSMDECVRKTILACFTIFLSFCVCIFLTLAVDALNLSFCGITHTTHFCFQSHSIWLCGSHSHMDFDAQLHHWLMELRTYKHHLP